MQERRRATLVALQSLQYNGTPCDIGHSIAHRIAQAGEELPALVEPWTAEYSVFGERRQLLSVPTFLESRESPFTREGRRRLALLERMLDVLRARHSPGALDMVAERVLRAQVLEDEVYELRRDKDKMQSQIHELEEVVTALGSQLKGKLG